MKTQPTLRRIAAMLILIWRRRGYWLRALVCYLIGLIVLYTGNHSSFDLRYQIRGKQELNNSVAIITISQQEAADFEQMRSILPVREVTDFTDAFYWEKKTWKTLLEKLLSSDVKSIGITLFFGDNIGNLQFSKEEKALFHDSRIVWSAAVTSENRLLPPRFANPYGDNMGVGEILQNVDRVVRFFDIRSANANHLSLSTIQASQLNIENAAYLLFRETQTINYRGPSGHFPTFSLSEVLASDFDVQKLSGKIIYIGARDSAEHVFYTPLGIMNRAEIFANISENILHNQWIRQAPLLLYAIALFFLLIPSIWLVMSYPQGGSLFAFAWIGTLISALSAWLFDQSFFWIPALSPSVQLSAIWVVFVGYQALIAERKNWALEQEQELNRELEQLKNNFVSLISHDLKTPIAKIKAMADQIMDETPSGVLSTSVGEPLKVIQQSSDELNKYIKTIINILRVESRQVKLRHDVTDINDLIEVSMIQLNPLAKAKKLSLNAELEPMFSVEIDPTLIQEVTNNLIENAIKYTEPGGKITVLSKEVDDFVVVEVRDTGNGIPEEELPKVWEKFARGADQEHKTKGSGLGLYLVKYFIELHRGEVFISSEVGKGTEIGFRLPVNPPANEEEDVAV